MRLRQATKICKNYQKFCKNERLSSKFVCNYRGFDIFKFNVSTKTLNNAIKRFNKDLHKRVGPNFFFQVID